MILSCAFILGLSFLFQEKAPPTKPAAPAAPAAKSESAEWPKLAAPKVDELQGKLTLYKRSNAERAKELVKEIQGYGKGAVPYLLAPLATAEPDWRARLLTALDALTDASDAARLVQSANSKTPAIRQYALRRGSLFAKPEQAAAFVKAMEDKDPGNRFYAALGATRGKSLEGLKVLLETAGERWEGQRKEILSALGEIRGPEATKEIRPLLDAKEDDSILLGLRFLAGAGEGASAFWISGFLDSTNNRLKEEAVNALRAIVDRAPPLEGLSVFDLIDQAKQWKDRLKTWKPSEGKGERG